MSYKIYDLVRMHGRDFIYYSRYWKKRLLEYLYQKPSSSIVLCNSFPKSGTHLLYQILCSIPGFQDWNDIVSIQALNGVMNTASHIRWKVGSAPNKAIVRSHLMYCDEILDILREFDCKTIFIYRDLRDVAVSLTNWVTKVERIFLHEIYANKKDFSSRLMSSIKGTPLGTPFGSNISQPDIGTDFSRYQGWIDDPMFLAIKFEDLVGERGGGSEDRRLEVVEQILDYLEVSMPFSQIQSKFSSHAMVPENSGTFHKGRIGNWHDAFSNAHKKEFKRIAGDTLIRLGYESDLNW